MDEFFDFAVRGAKTHYRHKPLVDGAFYHVFKRREDAGIVFRDDTDRDAYVDIMRRLLRPDLYRDERGRALRPLVCQVELYAFCLMDDHYHMVVWVERAEGLTDFMHRLQTAYGQRFNNRHGRRGPVFDERYDAELITDPRHLKTAIAYAHANPGEAAIGYPWSSHQFYLDRGRANRAPWVATAKGLRIFGGRSNYLEWFLRAVSARMQKTRLANLRRRKRPH
jgi:REP element-mobilizing transposase RayT